MDVNPPCVVSPLRTSRGVHHHSQSSMDQKSFIHLVSSRVTLLSPPIPQTIIAQCPRHRPIRPQPRQPLILVNRLDHVVGHQNIRRLPARSTSFSDFFSHSAGVTVDVLEDAGKHVGQAHFSREAIGRRSTYNSTISLIDPFNLLWPNRGILSLFHGGIERPHVVAIIAVNEWLSDHSGRAMLGKSPVIKRRRR